MTTIPRSALAIFLACVTSISLNASNPPEFDPSAFANPSSEFRPRTWFHMQNGNVTKEGMTKDIHALADAGMGGAIFFHIEGNFPEGNSPFYSDQYMDTVAHGVRLGDSLGLEMGMHNCDGWSSSAGPWVTPKNSMKKVAWSETISNGGSLDLHSLPRPKAMRDYYEDIAIIAIPATKAETELALAKPRYSFSNPEINPQALFNADAEDSTQIKPAKKGDPIWMRIDYDQSVTIASIHTENYSRNGDATLFLSKDGATFTKHSVFPKYRGGKDWWTFSQTFPPETVKAVRIEFSDTTEMRRLEITSDALLHNWIIQNAIAVDRYPTKHWKFQAVDDSDILSPEATPTPLDSVLVLHRGALPASTPSAALPAGNWKVFRFGYTSTAQVNARGSRTGLGLECDKIDPRALDEHFDAYVGKILEQSRADGRQSLKYAQIDSFEMGGQNWTHGFARTFENAYDYDIVPFLPAYTGRLIESTAATKAVLSDMRALVSNMMVEHYFKRFTELCNQNNLKSYIEGYGIGTFNELAANGVADIPMGEFWLMREGHRDHFNPVAISGGHIYGRNTISAEAFTADAEFNWKAHPYNMKRYGDHAWTQGINEFMFHRFAHQSNTHVAPGMTMGRFGAHIDRTQTWWSNAGKAWFDYIARGSYLLRQGAPVSDILILMGDEEPSRPPKLDDLKIPAGFKADFLNVDVLVNRLTVKDGKLVLPEGNAYQLIWLQNTDFMRRSTLDRIEELIRLGAVVVGPRPLRTIGYHDLQNPAPFYAGVDRIWGQNSAPRQYGAGWVFPSGDLQQAIDALGLTPEIRRDGKNLPDFAHRQTSDGKHLYFVYNESLETKTYQYDLKIAGLKPEVWHADSGKVDTNVSYTTSGDRTQLELTLAPQGSAFIVLREAASTSSFVAKPALKPNASLSIDGPWSLAFDPKWGGPKTTQFENLQDWSENANDGIRYYSGTAIYENAFQLPKNALQSGEAIILDLGQVEIAAEITVNGQKFPTLWKPPFALDIKSALHPGNNSIQIAVTNLWTNRLIGDESLPRTDGYKDIDDSGDPMVPWFANNEPKPEGPRFTFTTYNFYKNDRELLPSGLLGPVVLHYKANP